MPNTCTTPPERIRSASTADARRIASSWVPSTRAIASLAAAKNSVADTGTPFSSPILRARPAGVH